MKFDPAAIASQLAAVTDGDIETGKPLAPYTSYKIGGPTAVWIAPASEDGATNPFLDYRMNVTFTHPASGLTYVVPGRR